jgi:hypothetical protein
MSLRQWHKLMADRTANAVFSVFSMAVAIPSVYDLMERPEIEWASTEPATSSDEARL